MPDEFEWTVIDGSGAVCGARRTEGDARALARMLTATSPQRGPYTWKRNQ